jgi:chromosomal replication initiation ATPase DnaA
MSPTATQFATLRQDVAVERRVDARAVLDTVARVTGVEPCTLLGHCRTLRIMQARQLAMWLVRTRIGATLAEVGTLFEVHHTAVLHNCKLVADLLQSDRQLVALLTQIETRLDHYRHQARHHDQHN